MTLLPGETRVLAARYAARDLAGAEPVVTFDGWNIPEATVR